MPRRVLIIANPVSGGGRGGRRADQLRRSLRALGIEPELRLTTREQTGKHIAAALQPGDADVVAVVGGDGSLSDVVAGIGADAPPLALLPAGTANVWAREAHLPKRAAAAAALIAHGEIVETRIAKANGVPFLLFVGVGIDARIVRAVEEVRRRAGGRGGITQWYKPGVLEFLGRPSADLTVTVADRRLEHIGQVLVTRVRSYATTLRMPGEFDITDPRLHVLAFPRRSKVIYCWLGWRALWRRLRPGTDVIHVATDQPVRIDSAAGDEPYHRDGDHAGDVPVEIELTAKTVRLITGRTRTSPPTEV